MEYDINSMKRKMLVKYPFFGTVVSNVKYKEKQDLDTAATDGEVIYYNPKFLNSLNLEEQIFVFAHEVCHIAFNHILRSEGKDQKLWNIATDAVINQFLKKDGLKLPKGGVDIGEAINYNAEQLYEKLLKEREQKQKQQNKGKEGKQGNSQQSSGNGQGNQEQQQNSGSSQNSETNQSSNDNDQKQNEDKSTNGDEEKENKNVGHDSHDMWEDAIKRHKEKQKEMDEQKKEKVQKQDEEKKQDEVKQKQKELEKMGEKDAFKENKKEKKKNLEKLKDDLINKAIEAGTETDSLTRSIDNVGTSKALVDWRYYLREAIKYDVDWSYKNATIQNGVVTANLEEQPMPETEIVLDTSGSVEATLLRNFLRECKNILHTSKLKVGCFDVEFYGFQEVKTIKDIDKVEIRGGGGTNFNVAVNAFSRRVENKIIFTDGEASMPEKSINAIWIVYGGEKINPKGGRVIYVSPEQFQKLNLSQDINKTENKLRR